LSTHPLIVAVFQQVDNPLSNFHNMTAVELVG